MFKPLFEKALVGTPTTDKVRKRILARANSRFDRIVGESCRGGFYFVKENKK